MSLLFVFHSIPTKCICKPFAEREEDYSVIQNNFVNGDVGRWAVRAGAPSSGHMSKRG